MSGAQRTDRNRGQDTAAARAVSQARRSSGSRTPLLVVVVVVVLAVVVVIGVLVNRSKSSSASSGPIPPVRVAASYPVSLANGVVTAGKPGAAATVDAWEDFLCPICGNFEAAYAGEIQDALTAGRLDVRYHVVNLLDRNSNPNGYSLLAANAALCAADAGVFPSYHASLYGKQPKEGEAGYTVDQLVALGQQLGAKGSFESCVRSGAHDAEAKAQLDRAADVPALQVRDASGAVGHTADGRPVFRGTPSVVADGKLVNIADSNWLAKTIAGNPPVV